MVFMTPITFTLAPFGQLSPSTPFNAYSRFITSGDVYVGSIISGVTISVCVWA
jgi:hypothetical protein